MLKPGISGPTKMTGLQKFCPFIAAILTFIDKLFSLAFYRKIVPSHGILVEDMRSLRPAPL